MSDATTLNARTCTKWERPKIRSRSKKSKPGTSLVVEMSWRGSSRYLRNSCNNSSCLLLEVHIFLRGNESVEEALLGRGKLPRTRYFHRRNMTSHQDHFYLRRLSEQRLRKRARRFRMVSKLACRPRRCQSDAQYQLVQLRLGRVRFSYRQYQSGSLLLTRLELFHPQLRRLLLPLLLVVVR